MAMGESSDASFPAIYADLFGKRTFDNQKWLVVRGVQQLWVT